MIPRQLNEDQGIILPIVLILTLVLMITGLVFISLGVQENSLVRREIAKRQAFYLAEAGVEDARVQLGQDWDDCPTSIDTTPSLLEVGTYHADISESELDSNWREVTSTGTVTVGGRSKTVRVTLSPPLPSRVTSAIKAGGEIDIQSAAATINPPPDEDDQGVVLVFQDIFGVSKTEMKEIAQNPSNKYYDSAVNDPIVENITWINGGAEQSQITSAGWTGSGILIVDGNLKITGGTFDGIIWITGSLEIAAGNPVINGAIFVESDTTVDLSGNLTLNYDTGAITNAFGDLGSTGPIVESWEEL